MNLRSRILLRYHAVMLDRVPSEPIAPSRVLLLSGERGAGKSTLCERLAREAVAQGMQAGGIVCPGIFDAEGVKTGCRARNILSGEEWELGSRERDLGGPRWKNWTFSEAGFAKANRVLVNALNSNSGLIVADEIGPVELTLNAGFEPFLRQLDLWTKSGSEARWRVILVVRPELSDNLSRRYPGAMRFNVSPQDREEAYARLLGRMLASSKTIGH